MSICPHGVKVTSGLCLWSDPLETATVTSRSSVGAGAGPGLWAAAGHNISKPHLCRLDPQPTFVQRGHCFLFGIAWCNYIFHIILTLQMTWHLLLQKTDHGSALPEAPLKDKCWQISSIIGKESSHSSLLSTKEITNHVLIFFKEKK
jgi:hypothetical protein